MTFNALTVTGDTHSSHASLKEAIDQADMIRGTVDFRGVKIAAGEGSDRDTGYIDSIDGTTAIVRWDSMVVTACDVEDITAV